MTPTVSIVTLTYNHERFLAQCLESVRAQSFEGWEQIIIDDGSTDETPAIVARHADPRIRYVRCEHGGVEEIPNRYVSGLELCRGELIAFLDGDDYWPADSVEILSSALRDDRDLALAYGRTETVGDIAATGLPSVIPTPEARARFGRSVFFNDPVGSATEAMLDPKHLTFFFLTASLIRRSVLSRIGGLKRLEGLPVVDYPTLLRLTLEGRFHYVESTTAFWRVHGHSTTTNRWSQIVTGAYRQASRFRAEYSGRLPAASRDGLGSDWEAVHIGEHFLARGRDLLRAGRWDDARAHLTSALGFRLPAVGRLLALVHWLSTVVRFDLVALLKRLRPPRSGAG